VNKLPPVGLMPFSVGEAGALLDGDVVVVGVGVSGAWVPVPPHPAVTAAMPMSVAPPTTAIRRRLARYEFIGVTPLELTIGTMRPEADEWRPLFLTVNPWRFSRRRRR
jgi:hypothetical protein